MLNLFNLERNYGAFLGHKIFLVRQYTEYETVILSIADRLFRELKGIIIGLESINGWDGANLRIVVKDDSGEIIDRIMEIVYKEIEKHNAFGKIIPEIVKKDDLSLFIDEM